MMRALHLLTCLIIALPVAAGDGPYEPSWGSLARWQPPEWLKDAKFGIYTHWGPISFANQHSPQAQGWYASRMYHSDQKEFAYHRKWFGDQKTVGYKDIIPQFKAEKFNPDKWAEIFAAAGAQFAGPVAIHHDNFAMWNSQVTFWNSKNMGPKRDVTGELEKAIRARGMKFFTSFHHSFTWMYYERAYQYDAADGKNADLYAEPHKESPPRTPGRNPQLGEPPSENFLKLWRAKFVEVVDKYRPDLVWFDMGFGWVIPEPLRQQVVADYYNRAAAWGREVAFVYKHDAVDPEAGVLDFERGRADDMRPLLWMTDTAVGPWYHHMGPDYKSVDRLVDTLIDIVSKNGVMLLNADPDGDGVIPPPVEERLRGIGKWLHVNGEAVYGTRPWKVFGEGPTRNAGGTFSEWDEKPYTPLDIRFTTKDRILYAIVLGWPDAGEVRISSLGRNLHLYTGEIGGVSMLGSGAEIKWSRGKDALNVELPATPPCENAVVLKIVPAS